VRIGCLREPILQFGADAHQNVARSDDLASHPRVDLTDRRQFTALAGQIEGIFLHAEPFAAPLRVQKRALDASATFWSVSTVGTCSVALVSTLVSTASAAFLLFRRFLASLFSASCLANAL
jgi:hypothetical protein